jgi:hypothetical protein
LTTRMLLVLTFAAGFAAWAADYHPLDIKPGQWETTITTDMNGPPPVPPEVLARLTPEQRAKIEERTKSLSGRTTTHKGCLTKEKLDKPQLFGNEQKSCTYNIKTSTSNAQEIQVECANEKMKSNGTVRIQALDSENVKASVHMTMTFGDKTSEINSSWTSKWVGETCGGNN